MVREVRSDSLDGSEAGPRISPEELKELYRSAPDGILIVNEEGLIRHANPRAEVMFGYARGQLDGLSIESLVPSRSRSTHRSSRQEYAMEPHARPMGIGLELTGLRKDGTEFPVEISLSGLRSDGGVSVVSIVRDVTDRIRLRAVGSKEIQAAEDERRRIARDLHDETAQDLAALIIQLPLMTREEDPAKRTELSERLRMGLVAAIEGLRRIARGLRPPALDELGVGGAIEAYARELGAGAAIPIEVEVSGDLPLTGGAQLELYRIVQEALTNAVRHGRASRISVEVELAHDRVKTVVEDDGVGFYPELELRQADRGLGIVGMKERARHAGGSVAITSQPRRGTRVEISLPVATDESAVDG